MSTDATKFIENHLHTQRASKCSPVELIPKEDDLGELIDVHEAVIKPPYPTEKIQPSFIQVGIKEHRVCIRIDERKRLDRMKHNVYYLDDISSLKKLMQHMARIQNDYDRTTWFMRAKLIPSLLNKATELSNRLKYKQFAGGETQKTSTMHNLV